MQFARLFRVSAFAGIVGAATIFACSSSPSKGADGGMGSDGRAMGIDGSGGGALALGKKCGSAADCPANAPDCVGFQGTTSYCTPLCDMNATGTTNAMGQFTGSLTPAPSDATCSGAFTGSAGTPKCEAVLSYTPMDTPPKPNKQYTNISMACVVLCGANSTCPSTMTCNTTVGACFPM